jgi:hypothetical protein
MAAFASGTREQKLAGGWCWGRGVSGTTRCRCRMDLEGRVSQGTSGVRSVKDAWIHRSCAPHTRMGLASVPS